MSKIVSFLYDQAFAPTDEASGRATVEKLEATGAEDFRIDFVRTVSGEEASSYRKGALEALVLADQLFNAEPPMIATIVPLFPKTV